MTGLIVRVNMKRPVLAHLIYVLVCLDEID